MLVEGEEEKGEVGWPGLLTLRTQVRFVLLISGARKETLPVALACVRSVVQFSFWAVMSVEFGVGVCVLAREGRRARRRRRGQRAGWNATRCIIEMVDLCG